MKKLIFFVLITAVIVTSSCRRVVMVYQNYKDHHNGGPIEQIKIDSAEVNFPPGSVATDTATLKEVTDPDIQYTFDETLELFSVQTYSPNQIILNIGKNPPLNDSISITITLPSTPIPANYSWQLFAKIYQDGGEEILDLFDLLPSTYNAASNTLTAKLPLYVFTKERNADSTYEAIFQIATIPGAPKISFVPSIYTANDCLAGQIGCPLGGFDICTDKVTSPFGSRIDPVTGQKDKFHWGVDFGVSTGTSIYAVADGSIAKVHTQKDQTGKVIGYGLYVVVKHIDGSSTLYAHLNNVSVAFGQTVKSGQQIATSDNSGKSTGPHLHFEYVPNGQIINNPGRIDPYPCISENSSGSITVRDNGSLADDAFDVYLDDVLIGKTDIGASNSIALSNLIPGNKTLKLVCSVAPDNVGTYEVVLGDGLTFVEDGTDYRSGVLTQGGSTAWTINVPSQLTLKVKPKSRPNKHIE